MTNSITVYGRTYELDFSQEGSVLLSYKASGFTTLARVSIKANSAGLKMASSSDLFISANDTIGKNARKIIIRKLNEIIEAMEVSQEETVEVETQEVALNENMEVVEVSCQGFSEYFIKLQNGEFFDGLTPEGHFITTLDQEEAFPFESKEEAEDEIKMLSREFDAKGVAIKNPKKTDKKPLNREVAVCRFEGQRNRFYSVIRFLDGSFYGGNKENGEIITVAHHQDAEKYDCFEIARDDANYIESHYDANGFLKVTSLAPLNEDLDIVEIVSGVEPFVTKVYVIRFLDGTFFKGFETGKANRIITTTEREEANGFIDYESAHKTLLTIEKNFNEAGERPFQIKGGAGA